MSADVHNPHQRQRTPLTDHTPIFQRRTRYVADSSSPAINMQNYAFLQLLFELMLLQNATTRFQANEQN